MGTTYKYRYNTGTHVPNWNEWTPDVSTVCDGTVFQQQKDDPSGICPTQYQQNTGNKLVTWTPSTSNYCDGTVFYQTNTCDGSSRQATGVSVPNWSAWTPDVSTKCYGSEFTQTRTDLNDKCSPQNRYATGTSWSACNCDYNPTPNYISIPISEAQYVDYYRGGTWTVHTEFFASEYEPTQNGWNRSECFASVSAISPRQQGCCGAASAQGDRTTTYSNHIGSSSSIVNGIVAHLWYCILKSGGNYFLKIRGQWTDAYSFGSSPCGYPQVTTITVDGNTYNGVGTWCPGWRTTPGYTNSSYSTVSFTFNPSPRP